MASGYRTPIVNAPPLLTGLAGFMVAAYALYFFAGDGIKEFALYHGALFPERFWGWLGVPITQTYGAPPYESALFAVTSLFTTAFLHGDWMHVIINASMLVGVGKPVFDDLSYRRSGQKSRRNELFLFVFFISVLGGSLAHLLAHYGGGALAVGASGGVSGLIAALLLIRQARAPGRGAELLRPQFMKISAAFVVANIVLAFIGPQVLGAAIAWQAHIGGYVAGALFYQLILSRRRPVIEPTLH